MLSCGASTVGKGKKTGNNTIKVIGMVDDDEFVLKHVEALAATYEGNSETGNLVHDKSKDQDKSGEAIEAGCGVNPASAIVAQQNRNKQDKENNNREDMVVDERKISKEDDVREDEDGDYDYNGWHDFVRNGFVRDNDEYNDGGPEKGGSRGQLDLKARQRSEARGGRGQGFRKQASGQGEGSSATSGPGSRNQHRKRRHSKDKTNEGRDYISTSQTIRNGCDEETKTGESIDVILLSPSKHNHKQNRVIKDDDDFVDPHVTQVTQVQGGEAFMKGIQILEMFGCNEDTVKSVDVVLVVPPKHSSEHNCVIEYDNELVDPILVVRLRVYVRGSYGLVHGTSVLKNCNILPMVSENPTTKIGIFRKFREFFLKGVNAGNINIVYQGCLHLSMMAGLNVAIKVLRINVLTHSESTLAYLGQDNQARKAFH
ncbi:unnamed protein product [Eruca vesicaria subsp. sativa]|uniref:Uncharacterized protein n=1 Tax=Eruca vesicaria subsp. sativa TaxID=29727 RepID=A0ABC8LZZ9_ERUVS|nr:unnamed protein product [Eruca vesicaria subsp. sativa]